jgi:CelD/BcsL family acetyltransferase involved in cellulose biosynthesis
MDTKLVQDAPALTGSEQGFSVVRVSSKEALAPYLPLLDDLAARALDPNPFYEPWMLPLALEAMGGNANLVFLLVFNKDPSPRGPRLCGFFPIMSARRHHGLPIRSYRLLGHKYCSLCVPLVEAQSAASALDHFLSASRSSRMTVVEFPMIPSGGEFHRVLIDVLHQRQLVNRLETRYLRAFYRIPESPSDYLKKALSGKTRKHLRRQRERLAQMGRLDYSTLDVAADREAWLREFLDLEAAGWKGKAKTALASSGEDATSFMEAASRALERGAMFGSALHLDGRMIAGRILYRSGKGSYLFKIAYDETWAAFSPGTLLELQTIENGLPDGVEWTDSCTASSNKVFRRLWMDTRIIEHIVVSLGSAWGDLAVGLVPTLRWIKGRLKRRPNGGCHSREMAKW